VVTASGSEAPFPLPVADADTQPFWDATVQRRLVVQHCAACGKWIWQPKPVCPRCHGLDVPWEEVQGDGTVASWTVIRPPVLPAFQPSVPFVILLVALDDAPGVRMVGQLVDEQGALLVTDGVAEGLAMGASLGLRWREQGEVILPAWQLVPPADAPRS
jgi:uncharacterized protein